MFYKLFVILFAAGLILASACQVKPTEEKEYVTNVSGHLTMNGAVVSKAAVKAGDFTTASDTSGDYSLTVFHNGSFYFSVYAYAGKFTYSESISTKERTRKRDVTK